MLAIIWQHTDCIVYTKKHPGLFLPYVSPEMINWLCFRIFKIPPSSTICSWKIFGSTPSILQSVPTVNWACIWPINSCRCFYKPLGNPPPPQLFWGVSYLISSADVTAVNTAWDEACRQHSGLKGQSLSLSLANLLELDPSRLDAFKEVSSVFVNVKRKQELDLQTAEWF